MDEDTWTPPYMEARGMIAWLLYDAWVAGAVQLKEHTSPNEQSWQEQLESAAAMWRAARARPHE